MNRDSILVVDDNREMAKALAAVARDLGYDAFSVHSGEDALAYVQSRRPALMLLDLQMPGTSGFDVLRALRADRSFDGMPVVVCSAAPALQVRDEVMRLGAQEFIAKEDAFEELGAVFLRQIHGQTGATPVP